VEQSDAQIIRRVLSGEANQFGELVDRYGPPLLGYIQRMTGSTDTAEDLLQDVFLRVYDSLDRFDLERPFRPWIYKIATNACRDFLRTRKDTVSVDFELHGESGRPALLDRLQSRFRGPADTYADTELVRELYASIDELPIEQRQAFLLFHFQKFSQEEIAGAMEVPHGTVKSRLFHAYKKVFLSMQTKAQEWSEKIPILLISIFSFRST
jgi:RNA polymerase sigma-70 factor (ECF subfamily)